MSEMPEVGEDTSRSTKKGRLVSQKRRSFGQLNNFNEFTYYALIALITITTGLDFYIALSGQGQATMPELDLARLALQFAIFSLTLRYAAWFLLGSDQRYLSHETRQIINLNPDDPDFADRLIYYMKFPVK